MARTHDIRQSELRDFATELMVGLRRAGAPTHRLEAAMARFAAQTNLRAEFYALPTALVACVGDNTRVVPTDAGPPRLDQLQDLTDLAERVGSARLTAAAGRVALREVLAGPPRYDFLTQAAGMAGMTGTAALFLGGRWQEALAAAVVGLLVAGWGPLTARFQRLGSLFELGVTTAGAVAVAVVGLAVGPLAPELALLAGLIVVLPGFTLTTAMTELTTQHRIAGATGVMAAATSLLQMGVGVALGGRLVAGIQTTAMTGDMAHPIPEVLLLAAIASFFVVVLSARPRDLPLVFIACGAAVYGARWGAQILGPELGLAAGALIVTVVGNLATRYLSVPLRPAMCPASSSSFPAVWAFEPYRP